ncbi:hypothetical protein [Lapidilactobacillus luobeiensis]|uniref:hypothetical protein n=1 Tax=Lapidilactobacillus luobeiensis TaxID=2950371 RepID=UPI0021C2B3F5|nr:hypothetical protein [Lapidilactobacillus luobeiensis]
MKRIEILLIAIGMVAAIIAIVLYVVQIFRMPKVKRLDFKNLIMPNGSFWKNITNIVFILGILLILIGYLV